MNLSAVEAVVRNRLGLDPEALGASVFPQAVGERMRAKGVNTADAYLGILANDPAEPDALASELVVPETWFFRGSRALFDQLADFLTSRAANRPAHDPVRVLSVPCSTGEEPYSLAIALHERLGRPDACQIEAIDLSEAHVGRAMSGRFTSFAFRGPGPDIRPTYFQQSGERWELSTTIRDAVRFRPGNAIDPNFLNGDLPFDLILCRNLFIYLTADGRRRVLNNLDRLLVPDGWLCLTPAEADRLSPRQFRVEGPSEFGIYCRASEAERVSTSNSKQPVATRRASRVVTSRPSMPPPETKPTRTGAALPPAKVPDRLSAARELADTGRLAEARAVCDQLLTQTPSDPAVHSLLGVINQAEGRVSEAVKAFRKALYLDPDHADALSHMIVICERRGDVYQATTFRKRLSRGTREEPI